MAIMEWPLFFLFIFPFDLFLPLFPDAVIDHFAKLKETLMGRHWISVAQQHGQIIHDSVLATTLPGCLKIDLIYLCHVIFCFLRCHIEYI